MSREELPKKNANLERGVRCRAQEKEVLKAHFYPVSGGGLGNYAGLFWPTNFMSLLQ